MPFTSPCNVTLAPPHRSRPTRPIGTRSGNAEIIAVKRVDDQKPVCLQVVHEGSKEGETKTTSVFRRLANRSRSAGHGCHRASRGTGTQTTGGQQSTYLPTTLLKATPRTHPTHERVLHVHVRACRALGRQGLRGHVHRGAAQKKKRSSLRAGAWIRTSTSSHKQHKS